MKKDSKIFVAGHKGLVGSAILRELQRNGFSHLIFKTRDELNLLDFVKVKNFFSSEKPEYVFLAAAKVGGIYANSTYPAEFIYENLMIQNNVIHSSYLSCVKKLLFLGSSCIYPKLCPQPIKEEYLLSGELEPTNEPYAIAKISGIKMCESYNRQYKTNFFSVMPTNIYGLGDNFHPENSHVIPALIYKIHKAKTEKQKSVKLWGTGNPKREFLYVDDLAKACVFLMENYNENKIINVGSGVDLTIRELAFEVSKTVGYDGEIDFDSNMPDGTPRKLLDVSRIKSLGWSPSVDLKSGLKLTYDWYLKNAHSFSK